MDARAHTPPRRQRLLRSSWLWAFGAAVCLMGLLHQGVHEQDNCYSPDIIAPGQLSRLSEAVRIYCNKMGECPQSLQQLVQPPQGKAPLMEALPSDPWGNAYVYVPPTNKEDPGFLLFSRGPDGVTGTQDDIVAPKPIYIDGEFMQ